MRSEESRGQHRERCRLCLTDTSSYQLQCRPEGVPSLVLRERRVCKVGNGGDKPQAPDGQILLFPASEPFSNAATDLLPRRHGGRAPLSITSTA